MFRPIFVILSTICCAAIKADVSHLMPINNHNFRAFNGYNYNPPSPQLPSPAPPPTTTFFPEIIVNKGIEWKFSWYLHILSINSDA